MKTNSFAKIVMPLFLLFVVVGTTILWLQPWLSQHQFDAQVLFSANTLLFLLSAYTLAMHTKEIDKKNPNTALRGVLLATLLKLLILGAAAILYIIYAKQKSSYSIFASMGLYFIYTFIEVSIASKIKKQ
jgi:heme/copper-type cytochrome/quinol oxidase subunit 3